MTAILIEMLEKADKKGLNLSNAQAKKLAKQAKKIFPDIAGEIDDWGWDLALAGGSPVTIVSIVRRRMDSENI
jgi:hypothetical protein